MADDFGVRIEGVRELVRAIGSVDKSYRKEIGQRNKAIGQRIIDRAYPKAQPSTVGQGTGAKMRASAATTSLRIMAGGAHRDFAHEQWGKRRVRPIEGGRPYIRRSAVQNLGHAEQEWLDALLDVARKAGFDTKG